MRSGAGRGPDEPGGRELPAWPGPPAAPPLRQMLTTPEIDEIIRGEPGGDEHLAELRPSVSRFTCWRCEDLGPGADGVVSVIVLRYRDGHVIRFAHAACTSPRVVEVDDTSPAGPRRQSHAPGVPVCLTGDVTVTLRWTQHGPGLTGQITMTNISDHACRLPGKPWVQPNGQDGQPLGVRGLGSHEFIEPGYADLQPGQQAIAEVSWRSWCGPAAGPTATVIWEGGTATVSVEGQGQPECQDGRSSEIIGHASAWFTVRG